MSETVSKSRSTHFIYFALAAFALLGGFYVTSRVQHWNVTMPSVVKVDSGATVSTETPAQRAEEYAAYKRVFLQRVEDYKVLRNQEGNASVLKLLDERLAELSAIEADYIKLRPTATEPDRIKLKKMIGQYSSIYDQLVKLDYELSAIREARGEITTAHSILLLTSPELYAHDREEVKKILKEADAGTYNVYQIGMLKQKVDFLTEVALSRLKPAEQAETPEMRLQAGMEAIELYLNEMTARNRPPKPAHD